MTDRTPFLALAPAPAPPSPAGIVPPPPPPPAGVLAGIPAVDITRVSDADALQPDPSEVSAASTLVQSARGSISSSVAQSSDEVGEEARRLVTISAAELAGQNTPSANRGVTTLACDLDPELFYRLFITGSVVPIDGPCFKSGLALIGNTERSYISPEMVAAAGDDPIPSLEDLSSNRFEALLTDPLIQTTLDNLDIDPGIMTKLEAMCGVTGAINLQALLGQKLSTVHVRHLCAYLLILCHRGLEVIDLDLQLCNGFDKCWTDADGNARS